MLYIAEMPINAETEALVKRYNQLLLDCHFELLPTFKILRHDNFKATRVTPGYYANAPAPKAEILEFGWWSRIGNRTSIYKMDGKYQVVLQGDRDRIFYPFFIKDKRLELIYYSKEDNYSKIGVFGIDLLDDEENEEFYIDLAEKYAVP